jgi:hypothetical protein
MIELIQKMALTPDAPATCLNDTYLANEIREQKYLRQRLESDLRRTVESYLKMIDSFASADDAEEPA